MFAVIEFSPEQGGGLSLVNSKWLTPRKKEVFWPPYKEQSQFNRSVKKNEDINTETWRLYNVRRIFYEDDDYEQALAKLKKAEETSDLQSEIEGEHFSIKKRKIAKPIRYIESSSDSDDNRLLPQPPAIKKALFKDTTLSSTRKLCASSFLSSETANAIPDAPRRTDKGSSISGNPITRSVTPVAEKSILHVLLENIIEIKNQNKSISSTLSKLVEAAKSKTSLDTIPVKFPIKKLLDLDTLEKILEQQNNSNLLKTYYSGLGGNNINSKTNRILKDTLHDSLVVQFNFYGRNNKKPFSNLKLTSCIIDAVKSACGCTSTEEGAIKVWLKHAAQRLKCKGRKRDANFEEIAA